MKMLKDTVNEFKKKSLSRQRKSYASLAANSSALNQTATGDVSLLNQSTYDAIIQDPKIVKQAAREARIEQQESKKARRDVIKILTEILENRQVKVKAQLVKKLSK